jgi:disulfide bond formation protein DsbB
MAFLDALLKRWPLFAFIASAAMLAIAHGFETFGRLAPCHFCLQQREAYWWALAVSGIAMVVALIRPAAPTPRIASLVLALVFAYGAYLAAFQAGAEWKWWPAPATCASGGAKVSLADVKALMSGHAVALPPCDKPAWIFLGLSMAGWNFLASAGLVVLSFAAALRRKAA